VDLIASIGKGPVALDSAIFIYFIERHRKYLSLLQPLFAEIDRGTVQGVTSVLTLLETLVVPYRAGDRELASSYEAILLTARGLTLLPMDLPTIRLAAQIRASTSARTADALQLATALSAKCTALLTNDKRVPALPGLRVIQLESFIPGE
jgi:predicted nucleic acid-binding protein